MTPDRYEVALAGRRRLEGTIQKRGAKMGMSTGGGMVFGGVFVAIGTAVMLIGAKVIGVNSNRGGWPDWVLMAFGGTFALAGLYAWGLAGRQLAANRRRAEAAGGFRDEPALADYAWHPDGFDVSEWPALAKGVALALGLTIFLSMFNWWAFGAHGPMVVKFVVGLFDCVLLAVWGAAVRQLGRALKFGHSRVEFASFPFSNAKPVVVRWQPFRGISRVNKGTFTLRCVLEWMESQGSGDDRTIVTIHEEIWSARWLVEQPRNLQLQERVELRYELPADALPTQLAADKPVFWELEVKLDLPGLDFDETYLVPVYGKG